MFKSPKPKTAVELYQSLRRDWNGVNPVTKIIPNKKKPKRHPKHKKENYHEQE